MAKRKVTKQKQPTVVEASRHVHKDGDGEEKRSDLSRLPPEILGMIGELVRSLSLPVW